MLLAYVVRLRETFPGDLWRHCGGLGKEILMPYPINQSWREQIELNWIGARVGLWDTALKFLSRGPRNDVTDHLVRTRVARCEGTHRKLLVILKLEVSGCVYFIPMSFRAATWKAIRCSINRSGTHASNWTWWSGWLIKFKFVTVNSNPHSWVFNSISGRSSPHPCWSCTLVIRYGPNKFSHRDEEWQNSIE